MITIIKSEVTDKNGLKTSEYRGLSTDNKPTENVGNGSTFIEIDTGKIFFYDLDSTSWKEVQ